MTSKYRKEHFITRPTRQLFPTEFICFDTETDIIELPDKTVIFPCKLGVFIHTRLDYDQGNHQHTSYYFNTTDEFWQQLTSITTDKKELYIFAHNVGFDIRALKLPEYLIENDIDAGLPIMNNRLFIWSVNTEQKTYTFLDSANYGVHSIDQLGDDIGIPKMDIDFKTATTGELWEYCENDVKILTTFFSDYIPYIKTNNLGSFRVSIASQSLQAYRTSFMKEPIKIHNNQAAIDLERRAYFGGRVECHWIGKAKRGTYYKLDVNSMYPYIMTTTNQPNLFYDIKYFVPLEQLSFYLSNFYCIAAVELNTKINAFPLRYKNKLVFPTGTYKTCLHHPELQLALQTNSITKIEKLALYRQANLFADYSQFFYQERLGYKLAGDKTHDYITKLFGNSLYGKFGQYDIDTEEIGTLPKHIVYRLKTMRMGLGEDYTDIAWFGTLYREKKHGEATYSFPAIAGSITAHARMFLFELMHKAGLQNLLYVDTDSLIVNHKGYRKLIPHIDKTRLGGLKIEGISEHVVIHNNKDYEFDNTIKHKGISPKATQLDDNLWQQLQFTSFRAYLNTGEHGLPKAKYINKSRATTYNKGTGKRNRGTRYPIHFD